MTWLVCSVKMMEASDNQINTFDGHGPGGRVVACTKKPALRLACLVDYTGKISNFFEDLEKLNRFSESIEDKLLNLMIEKTES